MDTEQCVHPYGGWPNDGVRLTYWTGCNTLERLELEFINIHQLNTFVKYSEYFYGTCHFQKRSETTALRSKTRSKDSVPKVNRRPIGNGGKLKEVIRYSEKLLPRKPFFFSFFVRVSRKT